MSDHKFYICARCGNLVGLIESSGAPIICCGEPMKKLEANTSEGAGEKHLPAVKVEGGRVVVNVGAVMHPMTEEHLIRWVYLQTEKGGQRKAFRPGDAPAATFLLEDDKPVAVFAYCNLHGLWKTEL